MSIDMAAMHSWVVSELISGLTLRESMNRIISECSSAHAHKDWDALRALPYEDLEELREWIEMPFRLNAPPVKLAGLWFGIFNPIRNKKDSFGRLRLRFKAFRSGSR